LRKDLLFTMLMLVSIAFCGCAGAGGQHVSGEFYQQVEGSVSWDERHVHETQHYRIESNCSLDAVEMHGRTLETLYDHWRRHICKPPGSKRFPVQVYASRLEFNEALKKPDSVRGLYGHGAVITYHGTWGGSTTRDSLFHEGTHQLHDACMGIKKTPIWFAEGLARFFENMRPDAAGKLRPVLDADGLERTLCDFEDRAETLPELLSTPKDKCDIDCYDRAHLLVYFLINTTERNKRLFNSYWRALLKEDEGPGSEVFIRILGGTESLQDFEKRWRKWVRFSASHLPNSTEETPANPAENSSK
jgi:hypothetical protein